MNAAVALVVGLLIGTLLGWLVCRMKQIRLETLLEAERQASQEKVGALEAARQQLADTFKALCADALRGNSETFLQMAHRELETFQARAVAPIQDSLAKMERQIREMEEKRAGAYEGLLEQVRAMAETETHLSAEIARLAQALRSPNVRGRWGEIQLRRIVEMAGMLNHCDFLEQETVNTEEARWRPDLVVKLPGKKHIIVDAKVPLDAFLEALNATDERSRQVCLQQHARQIRKHAEALSKKAYWKAFSPAPEFVVLFVPSEACFRAALEHDPALIEMGPSEGVLLASPITLIALLRVIAYGWREESLTRNAQQVHQLGREFYDRLRTLVGYMQQLGKGLRSAVEAYNDTVASLETRVLVSARRFRDLGVVSEETEVAELSPLASMPRPLHHPEPLPTALPQGNAVSEEPDEAPSDRFVSP